jgi:hypothetical protein
MERMQGSWSLAHALRVFATSTATPTLATLLATLPAMLLAMLLAVATLLAMLLATLLAVAAALALAAVLTAALKQHRCYRFSVAVAITTRRMLSDLAALAAVPEQQSVMAQAQEAVLEQHQAVTRGWGITTTATTTTTPTTVAPVLQSVMEQAQEAVLTTTR